MPHLLIGIVMKKFIIKMVLDMVFDALLGALQKKAMQSKSKVDDKMVKVIAEEADEIKAELIRKI